MEAYKTIFDTWRSQVDSSATQQLLRGLRDRSGWRTSAAGEWFSAVAGRRWIVFRSGFFLTLIWYRSTKTTQAYVRHWWDSISAIEDGLARFDFARQQETRGKDEYRKLLRQTAWISLVSLGFFFS